MHRIDKYTSGILIFKKENGENLIHKMYFSLFTKNIYILGKIIKFLNKNNIWQEFMEIFLSKIKILKLLCIEFNKKY